LKIVACYGNIIEGARLGAQAAPPDQTMTILRDTMKET